MAPVRPRRRPNPDFQLVVRAVDYCIKSKIGSFSFGRTIFVSTNPTKKTKPPARSGSRIALFRSLELRTSGPTKTGPGEFEKAPLRAAALAEPGRLQIPYPYTLRLALSGQQRPSTAAFFTGSGRYRSWRSETGRNQALWSPGQTLCDPTIDFTLPSELQKTGNERGVPSAGISHHVDAIDTPAPGPLDNLPPRRSSTRLAKVPSNQDSSIGSQKQLGRGRRKPEGLQPRGESCSRHRAVRLLSTRSIAAVPRHRIRPVYRLATGTRVTTAPLLDYVGFPTRGVAERREDDPTMIPGGCSSARGER